MSTAAEVVRALTRDYEKGAYTHSEVVTKLVEAAAECPVGELADALPGDWLAEVKSRTLFPPGSPENVIYIGSALLHPRIDPDQYLSEKRQRWQKGARTWHDFFAQAPNKRLP